MQARYVCAVLASLVLALSGISASAATPLPTPAGRSVYDTADVIEPEREAAMEDLHRQLLEKAGVAIVVVTVPRLVDETIDELALRIGEEWGVGKKGEDYGLVVALSAQERQIFVATGYGMEAFLPDGRVGRMIDVYAMPLLREGQLSEGLYLLSSGLAKASAEHFEVSLADMPSLPAPPEKPSLGLREVLIGIVLVVLLIFLAWRHPTLFFFLLLFATRRGHWGGGGFGGGSGFGGFGGGGFGGGGSGRGF